MEVKEKELQAEKTAKKILSLKKRIEEKAAKLSVLAVEGKIVEITVISKEIATLQGKKIALENEGITDALQGMLASFRDLPADYLAKKLDLSSYWQMSERTCQSTDGQDYKFQLRVTRVAVR